MVFDGTGGRIYDRIAQKVEERKAKKQEDKEAYDAEYKEAEVGARKAWAKRKAREDAQSRYAERFSERRRESGGSSSMAERLGTIFGKDNGSGFRNPFKGMGAESSRGGGFNAGALDILGVGRDERHRNSGGGSKKYTVIDGKAYPVAGAKGHKKKTRPTNDNPMSRLGF